MIQARPRLALALAVLTSLIAVVATLRLANFDTGPDTVVDPGSRAFLNEVEFESVFGGDPIALLVDTDVRKLLGGQGLAQEIATEANLNSTANRHNGVQYIYGPAIVSQVFADAVLNVAQGNLVVIQRDARAKAVADAKAAGKSDTDAQAAGEAAAQAAGAKYLADALKNFPELAQIGDPRADNPAWTSRILLDKDGKPKSVFAGILPDTTHILVTARPRPETSQAQVNAITASVRQTQARDSIPGATLTITGVPVLEAAVARALQYALIAGMLVGAMAMTLLLALALRRRARLPVRLLPLASAVLTVFALSGLVSLVGYLVALMRSNVGLAQPGWQSFLATFTLALNPATLAAFPIALGLAVDYAVQFVYRFQQERAAATLAGEAEVTGGRALVAARRGAGRATGRAAICTVAGLLALMTAGIPMVRQFGVVMVLGVAIAWTMARLVTLAALQAWPRLGARRDAAVAPAVTAAAPPVAAPPPVLRETPAATGQAAQAAALAPASSADPWSDDEIGLFGFGRASSAAAPATPSAALAAWEPGDWDAPPPDATDWIDGGGDPSGPVSPAPVTTDAPVPAPVSTHEPDPTPVSSQTPVPAAVSSTESNASRTPIEPSESLPGILVRWARRRPLAVLVPALAVAAVGWVALPFSPFETDPERLVGAGLPAYQDLNHVRQATGSSGELDFILTGNDVTSAEALTWIKNFEQQVQRDSGGRLRSLVNLTDLLSAISGGKDLPPDQTRAFLDITPTYFTDALLSRDHTLARIAFGVNLAPVEQQRQDIERIVSDVDPPPGYTYYPAGFTYLGVRGLQTLQGSQLWLNLLGAALVLVALLAIYRQAHFALVAWAPTAFVAGWSTAILLALRQPLTPMTAVLGALVVAFGTEFAILWLERYREAVAAGQEPGAATRSASLAAGPGILLSGTALVLGFLALAIGGLPGISRFGFDLPMIRDFGLVAALDMVLAMAAALLVLPAIVTRFGLPDVEAAPARRLWLRRNR